MKLLPLNWYFLDALCGVILASLHSFKNLVLYFDQQPSFPPPWTYCFVCSKSGGFLLLTQEVCCFRDAKKHQPVMYDAFIACWNSNIHTSSRNQSNSKRNNSSLSSWILAEWIITCCGVGQICYPSTEKQPFQHIDGLTDPLWTFVNDIRRKFMTLYCHCCHTLSIVMMSQTNQISNKSSTSMLQFFILFFLSILDE